MDNHMKLFHNQSDFCFRAVLVLLIFLVTCSKNRPQKNRLKKVFKIIFIRAINDAINDACREQIIKLKTRLIVNIKKRYFILSWSSLEFSRFRQSKTLVDLLVRKLEVVGEFLFLRLVKLSLIFSTDIFDSKISNNPIL